MRVTWTTAVAMVLLIFVGMLAYGQKVESEDTKIKEMKVEIYHCDSSGYRSKAAEIATELSKEFAIKAEIVKGETGSFDVYLNGELIFSKSVEGRFPKTGEIPQKIKEYLER